MRKTAGVATGLVACFCLFLAPSLAAGPVGVFMQFEVAPSPSVLAGMQEEVGRILDPLGLRFDWRLAAQNRGTELFDRVILLRFEGTCSASPAAHLAPGGRFVVEVGLPAVSWLPAGELGRVFDVSPGHVGIDTIDDPVGQITSSHHWTLIDGQWRRSSAPYRYVWPSELDLMARLAGLRLAARWAGWDKSPFDGTSTSQVAVYEKVSLPKPAGPGSGEAAVCGKMSPWRSTGSRWHMT